LQPTRTPILLLLKKRFKLRPRKSDSKRGRPNGNQGTTRPVPEPDRTVEKTFSKCPGCSGRLKHLYKKSVVAEEIPKPQPVVVTEFVNNHYSCGNCGEIVAKDENCPEKGRFGNNVLAEAALMKFEERLPFRKIQESLKRRYNLEITPASIMNMTRIVSNKLSNEHKELKLKIYDSPYVYADETSLKVDGARYWIWIFVAKDTVMSLVRKSRGKNVVKEVLEGYKGILVCDGWPTYAQFGFAIQRCWAHLLREADELGNKRLHKDLQSLFKDAKDGKLKRISAENRLRRILSGRYRNSAGLKQKIRNGFRSWFTFLEHEVEPTNNIAERALREHVVIRKIIGGLRSVKGSKVHEVVMSCFATWKMLGLNLLDTLVGRLGS
jgi:transposase